MNELKERFDEDPGSFTLTEFGQFRFMGREVLTIDEISDAARRAVAAQQPVTVGEGKEEGGMYL